MITKLEIDFIKLLNEEFDISIEDACAISNTFIIYVEKIKRLERIRDYERELTNREKKYIKQLL